MVPQTDTMRSATLQNRDDVQALIAGGSDVILPGPTPPKNAHPRASAAAPFRQVVTKHEPAGCVEFMASN